MGSLKKLLIALFFILTITLSVIVYAVPGISGMLVETYTAEYGDLSIYDDTVCYFVRNEVVYGAASDGAVNPLAAEGDLIRPFTKVVDISGEVASEPSERMQTIKDTLGASIKIVDDYKIEKGGIVSFFVDGYETTLVPGNTDAITKEKLSEISQNDVVAIEGALPKGYPVFKIVDNNGWEIISYVKKEHAEDYAEGDTVNVTFFERKDEKEDFPDLSSEDPLGNRVDMIVRKATPEGDYIKLVLHSTRFFSGVGQYRVAASRIVSRDVRGLLIENNSIATKDGVQGVYVKNVVGKYDFVPVLIYGQNDTTTVIADTHYYDYEGEYHKTVDPFDDVLRNPETVIEEENTNPDGN